eukprot:TRINITY_DN13777_c0_g1_i1.p1 TRINITY_DN13777_c0_g1~~TRINITY_DN13777_c0_g1_i1.p1  ORF type:complete len:451 (-),score=79.27 TRINITY_DN13777_c0_g1_i1:48-1400(-)
MKKQNVRTLSLIVATITYLLIGAAIFDAIESEEEKRQKEALITMESQVLAKYNISQHDFGLLEEVVLLYKPYKAGMPWKFAGSFYYATTVLTTIGYGHSTPKTMWGKLFTMLYASFGIPLGLVMFNSIGERLNRFSSFIIDRIRRSVNARQEETTEVDLILVVMFLSVIIWTTGATVFSYYERWEFFDALYYCFATLTTIGFGDLVALQQDNALQSQPEYVTFALFFIVFGLAVIAAVLNLMLLKFMTMNTDDENRDEIEAIEAARMTVKLDGDVIMGEIVNDKRYHSQGLGSVEDLRSVCSCTCVTCHPNFFSRDAQGRRKGSISPPALYSDYYQTPPRSRPESVHEIRSCEYSNSDYGLLMTPLQGSTDISQVATISGTSVNQASMEYLGRRQQVVVGGQGGHNFRKETCVTPSHQLEYRENISEVRTPLVTLDDRIGKRRRHKRISL